MAKVGQAVAAPRRSSRLAKTEEVAVPVKVPPGPKPGGKKAAAVAAGKGKRAAPKAAAPTGKKRKAAATEKPEPKSKVTRGMGGTGTVNTKAPLGVIDPASGIQGHIVVLNEGEDDEQVFDVMLVMVDPSKNMDKYMVLQVIQTEAAPGESPEFILYERWGRTGTAGQSLQQTFVNATDSMEAFDDKFTSKTGLEWSKRDSDPLDDKYRMVKQDFISKRDHANGTNVHKWQYWVGDDRVDGKEPGWYDYDLEGSIMVEQLYLESCTNSWLHQRLVVSGIWTYLVDLWKMTQMNVAHCAHTVRRIRRVCPGHEEEDDDEDAKAPSSTLPFKQVKGKRGKASAKVKTQPLLTTESKVKTIPVDSAFLEADSFVVIDDFDATLNQTNITDANNNNKYYRLQLLKAKAPAAAMPYRVWTRWGRVGETRGTQTLVVGPFATQEEAEKAFDKKFKDKTSNAWADRANFKPKKGKYELLEVDHEAKEQDEGATSVVKTETEEISYLPCTLESNTKDLVDLLFEKELYKDAMAQFDVDVKKLPLGNLTKAQVERGVDVLNDIEKELKKKSSNQTKLAELSSRFYTVIPHDFGRRRPPVIDNDDALRKALDKCDVLLDIEKATEMMDEAENKQKQVTQTVKPHPSDSRYASLGSSLSLVDRQSKEFANIFAAFENTKRVPNATLVNAWRLDRHGEKARFNSFCKNMSNHKLLWHGTNIAVVAAICKSGLRIMPNAGGRVGKGLYLASENGKSYWYTVPSHRRNLGCMFLVEAALGSEYDLFRDDSSLKAAPKGFQSVVARGRKTPSKLDTIDVDGDQMVLPVGKPVNGAPISTFDQDEYLIYNEEQARIRYMITVRS